MKKYHDDNLTLGKIILWQIDVPKRSKLTNYF